MRGSCIVKDNPRRTSISGALKKELNRRAGGIAPTGMDRGFTPQHWDVHPNPFLPPGRNADRQPLRRWISGMRFGRA
jgi:hypothetical protein